MVPNLRMFIFVCLLMTLVYGMPPGLQQRDMCIDQHVWLIDGSVECRYIEIESAYGLHTDPRRWCAYTLTDCCETCQRVQRQYEQIESQNAVSYTTGQTVVQVQVETQVVHNEPQQMNNERQQMNNEPQQMNNEPQQMNNKSNSFLRPDLLQTRVVKEGRILFPCHLDHAESRKLFSLCEISLGKICTGVSS